MGTLSFPRPQTQLQQLPAQILQNYIFHQSAIMSAEYEGQDPLEIAKQAERDLNSNAMKQGEGRNQRYDNSTSGRWLLIF